MTQVKSTTPLHQRAYSQTQNTWDFVIKTEARQGIKRLITGGNKTEKNSSLQGPQASKTAQWGKRRSRGSFQKRCAR